MSTFTWSVMLGLSLLSATGCVGDWSRRDPPGGSSESSNGPLVERGKSRPVIDGIGWVVGIPSKIILWDRRIDNHRISPETEAAITQYVDDQELTETMVRINQYDPFDELRRLTTNRTVGWGWRYTFGAMAWLDETVFPGRIFGGDRYNPYTNTISIFSDAPAIAVKEGSRARDIRRRSLPGTYATFNSLPLVSMWHESVATRYAFEYLHNDLPEAELEGYHLLCPAFGAHFGSDLSSFTAVPNTIGAALGAIPGHIVGRYEGQKLISSAETRTQSPQSSPPPIRRTPRE
jgi:hypothetical protein